MDKLVQLVVDRTGISEESARQAIAVVVDHLKSRLPGPLAAQLDTYVGGENTAASEGIVGKIGDFFRKAG